jgi:Glyoxalase-like domain
MATASSTPSNPDEGLQTTRSLDHFVILIQQRLETAAEMYRRMGFRMMPIMEHKDIGTSNVIIQFLDTYLELIGDFAHSREPNVNANAAAWGGHGDIYWQTSLTSKRLENEEAVIKAAGLVPQKIISAARRVRLPEGGWDETDSRSRYVWNEGRETMSLFLSDHRKPEAIWIPGYQQHPNGTKRVLGIRYLSTDLATDSAFFSAMFGNGPASADADHVRYQTPRGEFLELLSPAACADILPEALPLQTGLVGRGAGFTIAVEDLDRCRWALRDGGIPSVERNGALVVAPAYACGMAYEFKEA